MNLTNFLIVICGVLFNAFAQIALKAGAEKIDIDQENKRNKSFKIKKQLYLIYSWFLLPIVFMGLFCFIFYFFICRDRLEIFLLSMLWSISALRIILISVLSEASLAVVTHAYLAFAGPVMLLVSLISIKFLLNNIKFLSRRTFRS
jgi:hypothetical protein